MQAFPHPPVKTGRAGRKSAAVNGYAEPGSGRNILFGNAFKQVAGPTVSKRSIAPDEQAMILAEYFGLKTEDA